MTGALLAGGLSRRMGFNKAFIRLDGETIIERSLKLLKKEFDEVFIVANDASAYEGLNTRVVADIFKGAGSLGGVYTALFHSASGSTFVTACDMPYLNEAAVRKIINTPIKGYGAVVPFIEGRYHPMHALYSKRCLKPIETMIKEGNLRITGLFEKIRVKRLIEEDFKSIPILSSIENVNTEEDLKRVADPKNPQR